MELTEGRVLLREFVDNDVVALLAIHADPRLLRYYAPELGTLDHARMLVDTFMMGERASPPQFPVRHRRSGLEHVAG